MKSKLQQIFSTLFWFLHNIPADFNSAVIWAVSFLPLISSSLILFSKFFSVVSSAPTMICTTVTFMFPNFFWFSGKVLVFI